MNGSDCTDAVIKLLDTPEVRRAAGSSPAVHRLLQELLGQLDDEIATLMPLLAKADGAEHDRLAAAIAGRREIVEQTRTVLLACDGKFEA